MKSMKVLRWFTLVSVTTLGVACGGVSDIGGGTATPGKGGSDNMGSGATGKGAESTGAQSSGGSTSMGATSSVAGKDPGTGMGTTGGASPSVECKSDMDCMNPTAPCERCADGTFACTKNYCAGGKCVVSHSTCNTKCATDMDCPVADVACAKCADGTTSCPKTQCLMGTCQTTVPGCGGYEPCKDPGATCGTECKPCIDANCEPTNEVSYCNATGQCQPGVPQCGNPGMCKTAKDCGAPPPMCVACGNDTCASFDCIANKCVFACPPNPNPQCKVSEDCPVIGDQCTKCDGGMCAVQACLKGSCELVCPVIN